MNTYIAIAGMALITVAAITTILLNRKYYENKLKSAVENFNTLLSQKKSSEVRIGQISEQLAPFLDGFKYDPKKAHFIGNPIDYVIFEDEEVIFMEIKSGESKMTKKQRDIRDMISNGKVRFESMQIK